MVPKLRVKEFCGEWEEKRLGDIAEIYKGNVLSKSDLRDEGHPCILYGELYTKYGEIIEKVYSKTNRADKNLFIGKINDVLIPSSGETAIDISTASCLKCDNVYIGGDLNVIRCNNVNGSFLSYTLNHKQRNSIAKFTQGVSVVHLYGDSLRKLKINIPSLPEQTKIAHFLCTVDDKIQNQQDKTAHLENIKKGFMQKIFSRKVRFKDDGGEEFPEWEDNILKNYIEIITGYPFDSEKFIEENNNNPIIRIRDLQDNKISLFTTENYDLKYKVYKGDILIGMDGDFYITMWKGIEVGLNQRIMKIRPKKGLIKNNFLYYLLIPLIKHINDITPFTTVKHLSSKDILNLKVKLPCLKEQQKIADFLSSFDEKIYTEKEVLEHLKQLKKGLLQQMFV